MSKTMPKFSVTIIERDGFVHKTEGWGVIRKSDALQIIQSELGADRALSVTVTNGRGQTWSKRK